MHKQEHKSCVPHSTQSSPASLCRINIKVNREKIPQDLKKEKNKKKHNPHFALMHQPHNPLLLLSSLMRLSRLSSSFSEIILTTETESSHYLLRERMKYWRLRLSDGGHIRLNPTDGTAKVFPLVNCSPNGSADKRSIEVKIASYCNGTSPQVPGALGLLNPRSYCLLLADLMLFCFPGVYDFLTGG